MICVWRSAAIHSLNSFHSLFSISFIEIDVLWADDANKKSKHAVADCRLSPFVFTSVAEMRWPFIYIFVKCGHIICRFCNVSNVMVLPRPSSVQFIASTQTLYSEYKLYLLRVLNFEVSQHHLLPPRFVHHRAFGTFLIHFLCSSLAAHVTFSFHRNAFLDAVYA